MVLGRLIYQRLMILIMLLETEYFQIMKVLQIILYMLS
nr:MAG TPA: hypothetical protein [Caudoviricetes sp.]